jgi:hypothetical protein
MPRRQKPAITLQEETHVMRFLVIATLVTVSIASPALAQRSVRQEMNDMKAKYGQTFDQCQALAVSRGFRLSDMGDNSNELRNVMMFIDGCIMARQR